MTLRNQLSIHCQQLSTYNGPRTYDLFCCAVSTDFEHYFIVSVNAKLGGSERESEARAEADLSAELDKDICR